MKKSLLALTMLAATVPAQANILDKLKATPATKYELGVFKLELAAFMLTERLQGKRMANSGFKIAKFRTEEKDGKVYFVVSGVGKAKHMSKDTCEKYHQSFVSNGMLTSLINESWPNLSESEYKELEKSVAPSVELVSKENKEFTIMCS